MWVEKEWRDFRVVGEGIFLPHDSIFTSSTSFHERDDPATPLLLDPFSRSLFQMTSQTTTPWLAQST